MKTANQIFKSDSKDKTNEYIQLAKECLKKANEIYETKTGFIMGKMRNEVTSAFRKAEQCDCEFTAYAECHNAENWLLKMQNSF